MQFAAMNLNFVKLMNELVQDTIEFGLISHFERRTKRIMHIRDHTEPDKTTEFSAMIIIMKELHFVFMLYTIGVSAGLCVLVFEILFCKYMQFRQDRA